MRDLRVSERLHSKRIGTIELEPAYHPPVPENSEAHVETKRISAAARRQREYWERLKQDPERCKQMRTKEAERSRIYRKSLGEEGKARMREQTRLRQQRLRERRKESGIVTETSKKPGTRASLEAKREKDRLRQQKYRANMSKQKKTAVRMHWKQLWDIKKMETLCSSPLPNARPPNPQGREQHCHQDPSKLKQVLRNVSLIMQLSLLYRTLSL